MRRLLYLLTLAAALGAAAPMSDATADATVITDVDEDVPRTVDQAGVATELADALDARMTLPNGRHHVVHCRTAPGGCSARVGRFARMFVDSGARHRLDPYLLAAIAVRESGLDPSAVSHVGAAGILQLHPRGVGARVPFVRSERVRRRCLDQPGACQAPVVDVGAEHLAGWLEACEDLEAALGGYVSGRCDGSPNYSRRVLQEAKRLREARG